VVSRPAFAKANPLFAALDAAALDEIRTAAEMQRVDAGAMFFREGDPASSFFVLDSGSVKLTQLTPEGHQCQAQGVSYAEVVDAIVSELSTDLRSHMRKEEAVPFPAVRTVEASGGRTLIAMSAPITVMEAEHDHAGALLSELRTITDRYVAPESACQTFRALFHGLSDLEAAMHVHVHLENNVLFPRAVALTRVAEAAVE
jgi:hemerythrin-like domain-containing protein